MTAVGWTASLMELMALMASVGNCGKSSASGGSEMTAEDFTAKRMALSAMTACPHDAFGEAD